MGITAAGGRPTDGGFGIIIHPRSHLRLNAIRAGAKKEEDGEEYMW